MDTIRLNKYLSSQGIISRRAADELISKKQVSVNGKIATLGQKINPNFDKIYVNHQKIINQLTNPIYLILHKPKGYITTIKDELGRPSVYSLVPNSPRIYPVGRLDQDTTGLLLFTNNGELTNQLTHPKFLKPKTYQVTHTGQLQARQIQQMEQGIWLKDYKTKPAAIKILTNTRFEITITEGKYHQIRRMCGIVGVNLIHLHRQTFANLNLSNLLPGQWRYLTDSEISLLHKLNYTRYNQVTK